MTDLLSRGGIESPRREAQWLLAGVLGSSQIHLVMETELTEEDYEAAMTMAARRVEGEPLQYLTGLAGFRRIDLAVGPGVFIPRPETELVAERAMELLPEGGTVVDVGTGSGAIALSIADERADARVIATEASRSALVWTRKNFRRLHRDDLDLYEGDLLSPLPDELKGAIDVVVSNPPYVAWHVRHRLPADVVEHEPHEALFGGEEGRTVIARLCAQAYGWLREDGWLVVEIGEDQKDEVAEIFSSRGFKDVAVRRDLAGRHRIAEGRR